jgi:uncharacterized membrane protein YeaQ/YmgE (transglycosylase-associated protein family)
MTAQGFFSAIVVGLVLGALGRLVVPGRQPIGCLLTILLGIAGSFGGLAIANALDLTWLPVVVIIQVAVAAIGVAIVASSMRGRRR